MKTLFSLRLVFIIAYCCTIRVLALHRPCADFHEQQAMFFAADKPEKGISLTIAMALQASSNEKSQYKLHIMFQTSFLWHTWVYLYQCASDMSVGIRVQACLYSASMYAGMHQHVHLYVCIRMCV